MEFQSAVDRGFTPAALKRLVSTPSRNVRSWPGGWSRDGRVWAVEGGVAPALQDFCGGGARFPREARGQCSARPGIPARYRNRCFRLIEAPAGPLNTMPNALADREHAYALSRFACPPKIARGVERRPPIAQSVRNNILYPSASRSQDTTRGAGQSARRSPSRNVRSQTRSRRWTRSRIIAISGRTKTGMRS